MTAAHQHNPSHHASGVHDVTAYGAAGDGQTLCTQAIQAAIDTCAAQGGGRVHVPPGVYLTGTLWLRSHVHLHLAHAATLLASPRPEDYNDDDAFPQNRTIPMEQTSGAHLLIGLEVHDVAITGLGTINGHEPAFRGPLITPPPNSHQQGQEVFGPAPWRPGQMIYFVECEHVRVQDITLRDAPFWHLVFHGCRFVQVRGLAIYADRRTRNGDGIGVDCCANVTISDCVMDTSDDCITVRASHTSMGKSLRQAPPICEHVAVTNCVLRTRTCGVRIGVGDGLVRHVTLSNLVMRDVASGFHITGKYTASSPGVLVEHVRISQCNIRGRVAFHLATGYGATKPIRHIHLSDIDACCDTASYLGGTPDCPVTDVTLDRVHLTMRDGRLNQAEEPTPYTVYAQQEVYYQRAFGVPDALLMEHVQRVDAHRLRVDWQETQGPWQHALRVLHGQDVWLSDAHLTQAPRPWSGATVKLVDAAHVTVRDARFASDQANAIDADDTSADTLVVRDMMIRPRPHGHAT